MNECSTEETKTSTSCASLAALGVKLNEMKLFEPIRQRVQIAQKTLKDRPIDKVYDGWMAMLAGAHGLVEINSRWRAEPALQVAFGRSRCAEQSVVQQTLDACTQENVQQMEEALDEIYRQHSQGYQLIIKDDSTPRAQRLAQRVMWWAEDTKVAGRQVGWVQTPATEYGRPV